MQGDNEMRCVVWLVLLSTGSGCLTLCAGCSRVETPAVTEKAPATDSPALPVATPEPTTSVPPGDVPDVADRAPARLEVIDGGAARPAHKFGNYYLTGQPTEPELAEWKAKGVRTVISLRTPGEIDWDEKAAVEAQGMKFVSIPFRGADTLGDRQIEDALAALIAGEGEGVLLHCGTSNRVGAIWYAHRIRHDGLSPDAAMTEAKQVGLRNTSLTDVIDAYCKANQ
jgi:protein tyrosine phosphatase (PTP) superfamily phosphohydrolase (DUF442 family)